MRSGSFRNIIEKMCLEIIYLIYMYKKDLALNNLQWLICHQTKPNKIFQLLISVKIFKDYFDKKLKVMKILP